MTNAPLFTVSIYEHHRRVRGCLTLTIVANAPRTGRFTGLRMSRTRPFRYSAHASDKAVERLRKSRRWNLCWWKFHRLCATGFPGKRLKSDAEADGQIIIAFLRDDAVGPGREDPER